MLPSHPYVSDDNPFSESQFRTLKYRPEFPDRFGSIQDARSLCCHFFQWYNHEHHHSGIGLAHPAACITVSPRSPNSRVNKHLRPCAPSRAVR